MLTLVESTRRQFKFPKQKCEENPREPNPKGPAGAGGPGVGAGYQVVAPNAGKHVTLSCLALKIQVYEIQLSSPLATGEVILFALLVLKAYMCVAMHELQSE
jgi:hypothetical protein